MSERFNADEFYVVIDANEDYQIMIKDTMSCDEIYITFDTFDKIVEGMNKIRGE